MTRKPAKIAIACLAVVGAAALASFVLLVTTPAAQVSAGSVDQVARGLATADGPCGDGIIAYNSWISCTAMPTGRDGAAAAAVDDTIYVIGGSQTFSAITATEAYDPVSDTWKTVRDMPAARNGLAAAALDGVVYAIGGWTTFVSPTDTVEVYDPISDTWTAVAPLPAPRGDLAAVAVDGKVYAIGGSDGFGSVTDTVTAYDPVSATWEYCAPMPTPRSGLAAVVLNGDVYAIGGTDGTSPTARVEIYNTVSNTWSIAADMPLSRSALAAAAVGGKIYAIGGGDGAFVATSYLSATQEYDPGADAWRDVAPMPTARSGLVAVAVGGKVFAIGGVSDILTTEAVNEVYFPPAPFEIYVPLALRAFAP